MNVRKQKVHKASREAFIKDPLRFCRHSRRTYRLTHKNRNAANRTGLELGLEPPLWCAKYQLHVINTCKYKLQGVMAKADNP